MAIICGIVQLFDHGGAATTLSQIFLQIVAFPFFYFTEQFLGGFFSVILSFCLMRYVKLVENSNWFIRVPKNSSDFCHTLGFFWWLAQF